MQVVEQIGVGYFCKIADLININVIERAVCLFIFPSQTTRIAGFILRGGVIVLRLAMFYFSFSKLLRPETENST